MTSRSVSMKRAKALVKSPSLPSLSLPEDQAEKKLPVANIIELLAGDKCAWDKASRLIADGVAGPLRLVNARAGPENELTRRCYRADPAIFARRQAFPARTEARSYTFQQVK